MTSHVSFKRQTTGFGLTPAHPPGVTIVLPTLSQVIHPRIQARIDKLTAQYKQAKDRARRRQSFKLQALLDETLPGKVVFHRTAGGFYKADFTGTLEEFQAMSRFLIAPLFTHAWGIRSLKPLIADGALAVEAMDEYCRPLTARYVDNVWTYDEA
ncbi:hypothetical protein HOT99_gp108 [Caulobacter phage CcrBL10]|uniref:Uncharacterized protein n=1 Tax=Caulobacter phage CcrBL10 TaxID=2283269 RepID=A0A385ECT1_9CAUD|nr:hypothetical protein HOT99_gp108 [Caulobacter phage CcrBL10]AXQ68509.1 hypothetical protein CcrBL10_gp305 [Caulobacter phage CcrBL10]